MAIIHRSVIQPTKLELLETWLPTQTWFGESAATGLERIAAFRIDDPAGEVGVETMLVRAASGPIYQVPLTYRGAPLVGGEEFLIGTMDHSALGARWVYDAVGDPVYRSVIAATIVTGGTQAEVFYSDSDTPRPTDTQVSGSGGGPLEPMIDADVANLDGVTIARSAGLELSVLRVPADIAAAPEGAWTLTGTWTGTERLTLLVYLSLDR